MHRKLPRCSSAQSRAAARCRVSGAAGGDVPFAVTVLFTSEAARYRVSRAAEGDVPFAAAMFFA